MDITFPPCVLCGAPSTLAVLCPTCLDRAAPQLPFVPAGWRVIDEAGVDVWYGPGARRGSREETA